MLIYTLTWINSKGFQIQFVDFSWRCSQVHISLSLRPHYHSCISFDQEDTQKRRPDSLPNLPKSTIKATRPTCLSFLQENSQKYESIVRHIPMLSIRNSYIASLHRSIHFILNFIPSNPKTICQALVKEASHSEIE